MNKNTLAIAIASFAVGGVAVAAYINNRDTSATAHQSTQADLAQPWTESANDADRRADDAIVSTDGKVEYADVVSAEPITKSEQRYATVLGTEPIRETVTGSTPREVCQDVAVQERQPERDGNVGGTVAGAVIGGLVGNQIGKGDGRKLATVAGAVGGGFAGHEIDKRHVGGQVVTKTERQCHTVSDTTSSSRTVAWNVTYRTPEGKTETMRTDRKPGSRIPLGTENTIVGYDVTYRYNGAEQHLRMDQKPGQRLPVIDGQVVTQVAAADGSGHG